MLDQPADAPFKPAVSPTRRRRIIIFAVLGSLLLFAACAVGIVRFVTTTLERVAVEPWALLKQAGAASANEGSAGAFYRAHPGLARRYPTEADFVAASRGWHAKLAGLPATAPSLWSMMKSGGGQMNINSSNGKTTFSLKGYQGMNLEVHTEGGALTDLLIE